MWAKEMIRIEFFKFKIGSFHKVGSVVSVQNILPNPGKPESEIKISLALTLSHRGQDTRFWMLDTR